MSTNILDFFAVSLSAPAFWGCQPVFVSVALVEGSNLASNAVLKAFSMHRTSQVGACINFCKRLKIQNFTPVNSLYNV